MYRTYRINASGTYVSRWLVHNILNVTKILTNVVMFWPKRPLLKKCMSVLKKELACGNAWNAVNKAWGYQYIWKCHSYEMILINIPWRYQIGYYISDILPLLLIPPTVPPPPWGPAPSAEGPEGRRLHRLGPPPRGPGGGKRQGGQRGEVQNFIQNKTKYEGKTKWEEKTHKPRFGLCLTMTVYSFTIKPT